MLVESSRLPATLAAEEAVFLCSLTGGTHTIITAHRRHPACYGVYVGHPISGIRVGRILEMQDQVKGLFAAANATSVQRVATFFPMRTTHLSETDLGANTYTDCTALFSRTRAFTLQNRLDALCNSDGVLINFGLRDDAGQWRISKGIPFDWGWARAVGKPVVVVATPDNPNISPGLIETAAAVTEDLAEGVHILNALLPHAAPRLKPWTTAIEVFDFGCGDRPALDLIARLAEADARKHTEGGRAIVVIMPPRVDGQPHPSFHGQVEQLAYWGVVSASQAQAVTYALLGC